ncbi:calcium-binding protein [Falsiroseomonas tokyonensis]|uniref:Calcium-binding protein n=1 Tax=Falsiroseomonas tokyonensis TaxID=430521 RepID=A0ABV7BL42_9PROT|nr:calcium-binding protein [Falsiroseomonas tokyonensis]
MTSPKSPPLAALDDAALDQVVGGSAAFEPPTLWEQNPDAEVRIGTWQGDMIMGDNDQQIIIAGGGDDYAFGGGGSDMILGGDGRDMIHGGDGDDTLAGNGGRDVVDGGAGDDVVIWSPGDGADILTGGSGTDELRLERTGLTIDQVLAGLVPDPGFPTPAMVNGSLDLTGITGSLTINGETFRFSGFEKLTLSDGDALYVHPDVIP